MRPVAAEERLAAAAVLGLVEPRDDAAVRDRVRADPAVAPLVREMRQTLGALRLWQTGLESLPAPAMPEVRRPPVLRIGLAAAAAVVLAVGAGAIVRLAGRGRTPALQTELAWTAGPIESVPGLKELKVPVRAAPPLMVGAGGGPRGGATFGAPPPGARPAEGAPSTGGPRLGGGQGAKGGALPPGAAPVKPEFAAFANQFAFAFRVPERLPGGCRLAAGTPVAADRLRLLYRLAEEELAVFLARSNGPDAAFGPLVVDGRTLTAGRRAGVLIAFDGPLPEKTAPEALVDLFLVPEPAPKAKTR